MGKVVRLTTLVRSVWGKHTTELAPVSGVIQIPQPSLPFGCPASHVSLGDFFEFLDGALYGGKLKNYRLVSVANGNPGTSNCDGSNLHISEPDVVRHVSVGGRTIREYGEVKSNRKDTIVTDRQMGFYTAIQVEEVELGTRVCVAFYRHNFDGIKKWKGSEQELFMALCGQNREYPNVRTFF